MIAVVHCVPSLARVGGGPAQAIVALCEELARHDVRTSLLAMQDADSLLPDAALVRTELVPGIGSRRLRASFAPGFKRALRRLVQETDAPLIHTHALWTPANHAAAVVARELGLPLVTTAHGMLAPWSLGHRRWKKRLALWLYQRRDLQSAHVLHACSDPEAGDIARLGLKPALAVIPWGLTLPSWQERPLAGEPRVALFLGRIHPVKGLLNLVQAWATIRPEGWRCVLAGPDEEQHRAEVEAAIAATGLDKVFSFTGEVTSVDRWQLLRTAEVFVLPSHTENFGMVVLEALACGVPVLTTTATPWSELTEHRCGWRVEVGAAPLAEGLREAFKLSDDERRAMGERGRRLVEESYSWPRQAVRMRDLYAWVLGEGPKPGCVHAAGADPLQQMTAQPVNTTQ